MNISKTDIFWKVLKKNIEFLDLKKSFQPKQKFFRGNRNEAS